MKANVEMHYNNYTAVFEQTCPTEKLKRTQRCKKVLLVIFVHGGSKKGERGIMGNGSLPLTGSGVCA